MKRGQPEKMPETEKGKARPAALASGRSTHLVRRNATPGIRVGNDWGRRGMGEKEALVEKKRVLTGDDEVNRCHI